MRFDWRALRIALARAPVSKVGGRASSYEYILCLLPFGHLLLQLRLHISVQLPFRLLGHGEGFLDPSLLLHVVQDVGVVRMPFVTIIPVRIHHQESPSRR